MKLFRTDCNTTAFIPMVLFTFTLLIFLEVIAIFYYAIDCSNNRRLLISGIIIIIFLALYHLPKIRQYLTIKILREIIWTFNYIKKIKTFFNKNPYNYFWLMSILLITMIVLFLMSFLDGLSILTIRIETGNTLALTLLATFIPFIFAGFTYSKDKLSKMFPSRVVDTCFGKEFFFACGIQILIFTLSFLSPFMQMEHHWELFFQVFLIATSFLSALIFIWILLEMSKLQTSLIFFRKKEVKKLKKLFIRDTTDIPTIGALWYKIYSSYIVGIIPQTLNRIYHPLQPQEDCYEMAIFSLESFFSIIRPFISKNSFEDTKICLAELTEYAKSYYYCRQNYSDTSGDKVNQYITNEFKLIIESCANKDKEKFLELFIAPIEAVGLSACKYKKIGMSSNSLIYGWSELIKNSAIATSSLQNTIFTGAIITSLGRLACNSLIEGNSAITETNKIKEIGILFARSKWNYHDYMVLNCFTCLNRILKTYFETLPAQLNNSDYFLKSYWFESYLAVLSEKLQNFQDTIFSNPLSSIAPPVISPLLNADTLPVVYNSCLSSTLSHETLKLIKNSFPTVEENHLQRIMFETRLKLLLVHDLYFRLVNPVIAQTPLIWNYLSKTIVSLVYIDLRAITKMEYFKDEWVSALVEKYSKLLKRFIILFEEGTKKNSNHLLNSEMDTLISIPAILLAYRDKNCNELVENLIRDFKELLCHILGTSGENNSTHTKDTILGCILLLAGWLKVSNSFLNFREELESILKAHKRTRTSYGFESEYISYGLPAGRLMHDRWYLFPSELWDPNLQSKIDEELMKEDELIEYAKQFINVEVKPLF